MTVLRVRAGLALVATSVPLPLVALAKPAAVAVRTVVFLPCTYNRVGRAHGRRVVVKERIWSGSPKQGLCWQWAREYRRGVKVTVPSSVLR